MEKRIEYENSQRGRRVKKRKRSFIVKGNYYEFNMLAAVVLLICFGLIMLYSTSAYICQTSEKYHFDDMYLLKKQAFISIGGFLIAVVISKMDYHVLESKRVVRIIYWTSILLMALVRTPLGNEVNGAKRWLTIGPIQFQPVEVAKIALIIYMSYMIVYETDAEMNIEINMHIDSMKRLIGAVALQVFSAYILTQNLSTGIIIGTIAVCIIFIAHPKIAIFFKIGGFLAVLLLLGVFIISKTMTLDNSAGFRFDRVLVWLNPASAATEDGYQILQGLYAIGSGGIFGKGLGNSVQKLGALPEAQNDMIFTIICEELGIFGVAMIFILFAYLLFRLVMIASNAVDLFGFLLVSGVFVHIALQFTLNIGVSVSLIPNTGITLPFFSYGGTSFLFLMAEIGLVLSVANQIRFKKPQKTVQSNGK